MDLEAPDDNSSMNGISLDNYNGVFRIFGIAPKDNSKTGNTVLHIDPYSRTIHSDDSQLYTFKGISTKATSATSARYATTATSAGTASKATSATSATYASSASNVNSLRENTTSTDIFSNSMTVGHKCWNKLCYVVRNSPIDNEPSPQFPDAAWYEVLTVGAPAGNRAVQIAWGCYSFQRTMHVRYKHDSTWSGWRRMIDDACFNYDTSTNTLNINI